MGNNGQSEPIIKDTKNGVARPVVVTNDFSVEYRPQRYGTGEACVTTPWGTPAFRTKQEAFRFIGHLLVATEALPDEEDAHDYSTVVDAVKAAS